MVEEADFETSEITESTQAGIYNYKVSSLNISCVTGYPCIFFVGSISV